MSTSPHGAGTCQQVEDQLFKTEGALSEALREVEALKARVAEFEAKAEANPARLLTAPLIQVATFDVRTPAVLEFNQFGDNAFPKVGILYDDPPEGYGFKQELPRLWFPAVKSARVEGGKYRAVAAVLKVDPTRVP